jgi:hypothetical protein
MDRRELRHSVKGTDGSVAGLRFRTDEVNKIHEHEASWHPIISALPNGLSSAAKQLATEVIYRKRHLEGLLRARKYRGRHGMAMHFGCGNRIKDGWVNIDLRPEADLTLDVRERLPFPDGTFNIIYSEHFLEHFDLSSRYHKVVV